MTVITIWCFWQKMIRISESDEDRIQGFAEGYYYKPRVDMEVLQKYHEGIIALSACLAGEVQRYPDEGCMKRRRKQHLGIRTFSGREISSWSCRIMGCRSSRLVNQRSSNG